MFGEEGAQAILKEMKQLDVRDVMQPVMELTKEQKRKALEHLMFLKQKRCGRIKGRGCADGRKQRTCKGKNETSSPTVTTESLFLSCVIDAMEGRDVATVDIPGAFMQAETDEVIHVRLSGPLAVLMGRLDPKKHQQHIQHEKGKPVLHAKLNKALCGTLQAAQLFWQDLTSVLAGWGFELNGCDRCVANKVINGKQCTILWHVGDLKISHVDPGVVTELIDKLEERCRKEAPLTRNRGTIHDCLGMTINCSVKGKVVFRMDDCV